MSIREQATKIKCNKYSCKNFNDCSWIKSVGEICYMDYSKYLEQQIEAKDKVIEAVLEWDKEICPRTHLDLKEAVRKYKNAGKCPTCSGKGSHYDDETGIETCPDCGGKGI